MKTRFLALSLVLISLLHVGCTSSPRVGTSLGEYQDACESFAESSATTFANGDVVMACVGELSGDENRYLFRDGVMVSRVSQAEVRDRVDHEKCVSWGATPGSPEYLQCRSDAESRRQHAFETALRVGVALDAIRSAEHQAEQDRQQQIYQNLQDSLRETPALAPAPTSPQTQHCVSRRMGDAVYTDCY